jgi:Mn-containing catalase
MTREITHMKAFMLGLDSLGKNPLSVGKLAPTPGVVDEYFNDSTGSGDAGTDEHGPWNEGNGWKFVEAPAFQNLRAGKA